MIAMKIRIGVGTRMELLGGASVMAVVACLIFHMAVCSPDMGGFISVSARQYDWHRV